MFRSIVLASALLAACSANKDASSEETGTPAPIDTADTGTDTGTGTDTLSPAELAGDWTSPSCEAYPDGNGGTSYLTRDFALTDARWALDVTIFGDAECSYGLFRIEIEGPYSLGGASTVAGATEGNFGFTTNQWTPLIEDMAVVFENAGCASGEWEVGEAQDVTGTGCIGVAHPIAECPVEHDIVSVDGDALYFGQRVTNMCEESGRPTALNSYAVTRQ